jgi:hypothetical protein
MRQRHLLLFHRRIAGENSAAKVECFLLWLFYIRKSIYGNTPVTLKALDYVELGEGTMMLT